MMMMMKPISVPQLSRIGDPNLIEPYSKGGEEVPIRSASFSSSAEGGGRSKKQASEKELPR